MKLKRYSGAAGAVGHPYIRQLSSLPPSPFAHAQHSMTNPIKYDGLVIYGSELMCILCNQQKFQRYISALRHVTGDTHREHVENYLKIRQNTPPELPLGLEPLPFMKFVLCTMCNCKVDLDLVDHHISTDHHLTETKFVTRVSTFEFKCKLCNQKLIGYQRVMEHLRNPNHNKRKAKAQSVPNDSIRSSKSVVRSRIAKLDYQSPLLKCRISLTRIDIPSTPANGSDGTRHVYGCAASSTPRYKYELRQKLGNWSATAESILGEQLGDTSRALGASRENAVVQVQPLISQCSVRLARIAVPPACTNNGGQIILSDETSVSASGHEKPSYDDNVPALKSPWNSFFMEEQADDNEGTSADDSNDEDSGVVDEDSYPSRSHSNEEASESELLPEILPEGIQRISDDGCMACSTCRTIFLEEDVHDHVTTKLHDAKLRMETVHNGQNYSCDICSRSFIDLTYASSHLKGNIHAIARKSKDERVVSGIFQLSDEKSSKRECCQCIFLSQDIHKHAGDMGHKRRVQKDAHFSIVYWCNLCSCRVGHQTMTSHVQGKRHRKNVTSML